MSSYRRYFKDTNNPVFITIVTKNRRNILIEFIDNFKLSLKESKDKFDFKLIACIVLRDHCHMLIQHKVIEKFPLIIRDIKYNFIQKLPNEFLKTIKLTESEQKRNEKGVWQRRYYDHIIRNEDDLKKHLDYIHYNSMKHYQISPKDWQFSSFKKFVQKNLYDENWCNFDDINKINEMNLE